MIEHSQSICLAPDRTDSAEMQPHVCAPGIRGRFV